MILTVILANRLKRSRRKKFNSSPESSSEDERKRLRPRKPKIPIFLQEKQPPVFGCQKAI
jgi:hypothetical protein